MAFNIAGLSARDHIVSDEELFRPTEVDVLQGDPTKAVIELGWRPDRTPIQELVRIMLEADFKRVKQEIQVGRHDRQATAARFISPHRE